MSTSDSPAVPRPTLLLEGKTVVVSGVGPGLGREVAAAALRDGARVVLGARSAGRLAEVAAALDPGGERVAHAVADVRDPAACRALAATAVDRFGGIDGLVNCAALDSVMGGLEGADIDEWHRTFEVNVFGSMQMTAAALPHLKEGGGSIVFIGSQSQYLCQIPQVAYAASKAALQGAVAHLCHEVGPAGVRVNTVVPSWMWGPPVQAYVDMAARAQGIDQDAVVAGITANMPLRRIPEDGDVADAVAFFLSDRARMVTGQSLLVNAGEYIP